MSNFEAIEAYLQQLEMLSKQGLSSLPMLMESGSDSSCDDDCSVSFRNASKQRSPNKERRRLLYDVLLKDDYWGSQPVYGPSDFKELYRMPLALFNAILEAVAKDDDYFRQKRDCANRSGALPSECVVASEFFQVGALSWEVPNRFRMADSTAMESLKRFCLSIDRIYGKTALRSPSKTDIDRIFGRKSSSWVPRLLGEFGLYALAL